MHYILSLFTPKKEDIEEYRKELILNIILALSFALFVSFFFLLIISKTLYSTGIGVFVYLAIISPLCLSYYFSRKGYITLASSICIATLSFGTYYSIHTWSFTLPASLLSLVLTTTITGILISSRAGFLYAVLSTIFITIDLYLMYAHGDGPDLSWHRSIIEWNDMIELSVFLLFASGLTWLSNRQTYLSLERARNSEALLMIERDQLEVRVEQRTKELEQAQVEKISEVYNFIEFGKLSAGLIHDIMSPLNALCIEIGQAHQEHQSNNTITSLNTTLENVTKASQKIQNILSASKKQLRINLDTDTVILHNLVQDIHTLHRHQLIKYNIDWRNAIDQTISLHIYPTLLSHIITNLVSNAIDACISKKESILGLSNYVPYVDISATLDLQSCNIYVADNGTGVLSDIQNKIFQPFFSTKSGKGCGYGLSVSKHIVEKYFKGNLIYKPNSNSGSTFHIKIPIPLEAIGPIQN